MGWVHQVLGLGRWIDQDLGEDGKMVFFYGCDSREAYPSYLAISLFSVQAMHALNGSKLEVMSNSQSGVG
jgi:hypothetical protein